MGIRRTSINTHEFRVIRERFEHYNVPQLMCDVVIEAVHALNAGKFVYDGTTLDEELAPNNLEEASLVHDYLWVMGWGGHLSNVLYQRMLKVYRSSRVTRAYRMAGITVGWYCAYKWRYILKGNVKTIPERFKRLNTDLREWRA